MSSSAAGASPQAQTAAGIYAQDQMEDVWCMACRSEEAVAFGETPDADDTAQVGAVHKGSFVWILFDSGSDEHMATGDLAEHGEDAPVVGGAVTAIQGTNIAKSQAVDVAYSLEDFDGGEHLTNSRFRVGTDALNDNVLSAGKVICTKKFKAVLDDDGSYVENKVTGARTRLYLRRRSFYLKARVAAVRQAAPVALEIQWEHPEEQVEMEADSPGARGSADPAPQIAPAEFRSHFGSSH